MASSSSDAWTEQEQQLLEEGLVKFAVICDVKEKWKAIAGHVGTRDLRACADRFKVCRQRALEQQKAQEEAEEEEEEDGQEADWRQSEWSQWKTDDWWSGQWWNGWQDRSWKEEAPMDEADRRKSEVQQEIEANRRKMEQKEEQKRRQEEVREAKLRAEREQKEKERQEQQQAREQKITEAREREKQQRLEEENRQRELRRKMEEDDAKAGFYGKRHLHVKGGLPKGGKGWGKGPSKGEISRQRREEEMEKNAREVLANIKSKKGADVPEIQADAADASETSPPDADVALPKKGAHEEIDSKGDGKGKGKKGKKGDGKGKHKKEPRIERWWTKIDGDCPISLVPIAELPVPPFGLKADGSSVPHYFDGRFLASFLLSSFDFINPVNRTPLSREDCVALDAHLRDYPDRGVSRPASQGNVTDAFDLFQRNGGTGTDAVRREATAVFQHLFRFTHSQNLDSRGRAINFNDGGLTVIDDDDIRVSAAQHTVASTAQVLAEREEVAAGPGPSVSNVPGPSGAWAKASSPQPEEFPALPGAKAKAGSKAKAKAKGKAKTNSGGTARGLLAPKTWATPK
eukprot:symbB.v1.2.008875.t1/scaffold488.1/size197422/8